MDRKPPTPRRGRGLALATALALIVAVGPLPFATPTALAATTFTVTTTGDGADTDLADPVCDADAGTTGEQCTLRAAIQEANATPGPDTIAFNIPGGGVQTIRPATDLPVIERKVTIDGYTQPGSATNTAATGTNAALTIELDGSATGGGFGYGLQIAGADTLVRGLVVNRFPAAGILLVGGATGARVQGCFLGTDPSGTAAAGNVFGVRVAAAAAAQVGGSVPAARNLISGNGIDGVWVEAASAGARVLGNLVGTDKSGAAPLGNGNDGVDVRGPAAHIGGATPAQANVIAFNDDSGVAVYLPATGVRVLRNRIFANGGLGIDLDGDGVTPNDDKDADTGPNALQNFPVIDTATSTSVTGTLNSTPNQDFVLRLFSNPGIGNEGKVFHAAPLVVTTDAAGNASFTFAPNPPIPTGRSVTATATNQGGSTSEFSPAVLVE